MKPQRPNIARTESADTYDLAKPTLIGPPLPGEVIVAETAEGLIDGLSAEMVAQAEACVRQFGDFHLALSGGSTPQPLYERLMYDPNCRSLPWARTHLWFVDERSVPFDDERSNYRMIKETIVDHSGIPREQVHPIFTDSASADIDYENQLREVMQSRAQGQDRCPSASGPEAVAGWAAYTDNNMAEARRRFEAAIARCDNDQYARTGLGYVSLRDGKVGEAERLWAVVRTAEPNNVDALVGLGLARWRSGDMDAVRTHFSTVLELAPGHATAIEYLERIAVTDERGGYESEGQDHDAS